MEVNEKIAVEHGLKTEEYKKICGDNKKWFAIFRGW